MFGLLAKFIPPQFYLLALGIALAAAFAAGGSTAWKLQSWRYGSAIAEQKADAEKTLRTATAAALKKERQNGLDRDAVEKNLQSAQAKNRALDADLRRSAAKSGGLRDPGRGASGGCAMPATTTPAGVDPGAATNTAGLLSKPLEEYIFDTAARADEVLTYAWACHEWAMKAGQ